VGSNPTPSATIPFHSAPAFPNVQQSERFLQPNHALPQRKVRG